MREVIDKYAGMRFNYGVDCCQFVGECIEVLHGFNPMHRFSYHDETEAMEIIQSYGTLEDAITAVLGEPCTDPIREGDVTLHEVQDGQQTAGIVYHGRSVLRVPRGLTDWPLEWVRLHWRVQ